MGAITCLSPRNAVKEKRLDGALNLVLSTCLPVLPAFSIIWHRVILSFIFQQQRISLTPVSLEMHQNIFFSCFLMCRRQRSTVLHVYSTVSISFLHARTVCFDQAAVIVSLEALLTAGICKSAWIPLKNKKPMSESQSQKVLNVLTKPAEDSWIEKLKDKQRRDTNHVVRLPRGKWLTP